MFNNEQDFEEWRVDCLNKAICLTFSILKFKLMWMNGFGSCENISTKNIFRREYYIEC